MDIHELPFFCAAAITLVGVWGHWRMPAYCSLAEEGVKDGHLSHPQARRLTYLIVWGCRGLTVVGVGLMVACILF